MSALLPFIGGFIIFCILVTLLNKIPGGRKRR